MQQLDLFEWRPLPTPIAHQQEFSILDFSETYWTSLNAKSLWMQQSFCEEINLVARETHLKIQRRRAAEEEKYKNS